MNPGKAREIKRFYEFGAFRLDPSERVFARNGRRIPIAPKAFDTLLILVQHSGRVLTKDELIKTLWPNSFVEENNLTQHISALRRALGPDSAEQEYIETVPKLGYRFACDVREIAKDSSDALGAGQSEVIVSKRTRTRIVLREEVEEEETDSSASSPLVAKVARNGAPPAFIEGELAKSARMSRIRGRVWIAAAATVLALTALAVWNEVRDREPRGGTAGNLVRLTSDSGLTMSPTLSPDGRLIAYASDRAGKGDLDIWVQPVGGGEPLRLTHDSTDDSAPEFSPDGSTIAFRSEREGGGIYIVSAKGGEARLVAPQGRRPKFSPDGNWIAYWVGTEAGDNTGSFLVPGAGKIYVVPASGGVSREIRPEFAAAGYPIWTRDGRHILFLGNRDPNVYHEGTTDWWVTLVDGGEVSATGASALFKKMGFASASQAPEAWTLDGMAVLMSATLADTRNIWRVPISPRDWKISGAPGRLTFGTSNDVQPSMMGHQLVFASLTEKLDIWGLPLHAARTESSGDIDRLTNDASAHTYPAVSPDGTKLAFSLQRSKDRDIWIKDLPSGNQSAVSIPPGPSFNPNFSPDGKILLYRTVENRISIGYSLTLAGGGTREICRDCSDYGWSSDMKKLVLVGTSPARVSILDLATQRRTPLLDDPTDLLWNARFSPDNRWVSFNATSQGRSRIFVAPVGDGQLIPKQEWIAVADSGWDDKPRWSPDGNTLYFVSERDGFRCIWAQRLDSRKLPRGAAIPVFHAHESRRSLSNIGPGDLSISVAGDKIVFNMNERTGNLWLTGLDATH